MEKQIGKKTLIIISTVFLLLLAVAAFLFIPGGEHGTGTAAAKTGKSDDSGDTNPKLASTASVGTKPQVRLAVSTTLFGNPKIKDVVTLPTGNSNNPLLDKPVFSGTNRIDCMIEPHRVADVASATTGVIKTIKVERGDVVKKGDILAVLENGVERANVKLAAAKLKFARENYARMAALYKKKVVSLQEKDKSRTELQVAILELRRAKEMLKKRTIISPLSGIVVQLYISPGEITDQQKVLKIASINPLKIEVVAPIKLLENMRVGMYAHIWPEGPDKRPYVAKVTIVDRVVDAASGTFGVRLALPNPQYKIPAGVKCVAEFSVEEVNTKKTISDWGW